jgi:AcrR family transcriptional regulator
MTDAAAHRRREPLSRARVLQAALHLVDTEGPEALSMRRLASALEVATMTIYHHVPGRAELLDGLSEVMVQEIGMRFGEAPDAALRRLAHGIRAVALAHPAAFRLVGMRPLRTTDALAPVDAGLGALRAMGFDDETVVQGYRVLVSFARGFALGEISSFTLEGDAPAAAPPAVDPVRFPHIAELGPVLAEPDRDAAFALGVDLVVGGLVARARTLR